MTVLRLAAVWLALSGCAQLPAEPGALDALRDDVTKVETSLQATHEDLNTLIEQDNRSSAQLQTQIVQLEGSLAQLQAEVTTACLQARVPVPNAQPADCPEPTSRVVVNDAGKLVLGEVEEVWITEPGFSINARIDTGASTSSVHAESVTSFERDGDNWVRFEIPVGDETHTLELPVIKRVKVVQQADRDGSRRPVVGLRVRLGDFQDTFEFTLADRAHLEQPMILGRNFLTDMALVDVSRQYVQPRN